MPTKVSYDGVRLLALARGEPVPRPFHFRWLLPRLLGVSGPRWRAVQWAAFVAVSCELWAYTHSWAAVFVPLGLAGVYHLNVVEFPILTDLPAMAAALGAALCARSGGVWWVAALTLVVIAGTMKETAPLFAACWAWNPLLLVGLVAPIGRLGWPAGVEDPVVNVQSEKNAKNDAAAMAALRSPLRASMDAHKNLWKDPWPLLMPWGILLVGLGKPTLQVAVTALFAYGQLVIATDGVRLYQWAFPVLALETFHTIPARWWWLAVLVHLANPAKTAGL